MRHRPAALAALALLLGAATPAGAGLLPFRGEVDVYFPALGLFVVVPGAGVAEVNGAAGALGGAVTALRVPAGAFSLTSTFPGGGAVGGLTVSAHNGAGVFTGLAPGTGGGVMPVLGTARLCLFLACDAGALVLDLPLSAVGAGGTHVATGPLSLTLRGAPWTFGTVTVSTPGAVSIVGGFAAGPGGLAGSAAQPGGVVELVTPVFLATSLPGFEDLDAWALLRVEFVPEPTTALLLGGGLALLAVGAARRR